MKFSFFINLFLAQCLSVYALDQNIPVSDEYQRRVQEVVSEIPVEMPVSYDCVFINRWTSLRHPNRFPTPNAFWSRPLMASHNNDYTMWSGDQVPSTGVQVVAERGSSRPLVRELKAENLGDNIVQSVTFSPIGDFDFTSMQGQLEMDNEHRLISTISRISPSPDWFSGLNSYSPVMNGMWLSSFTVNSFPWDAGSEDGTEYSERNDPTDPLMNSSRFTFDTPGVFLNTDGDDVLPVAQWSCAFTPTATPTATATAIPTLAPSLRGDPENTCLDSGTAMFFRFNSEGLVRANLPRNCMWLAQQTSVIQDRHCKRGRNFGPQPLNAATLLAKEACPETCGTCPP